MKVSVALCTYNGSRFIAQQIESILNQTISVDEIVVCDDESTDDTIDIIKNFSDNRTEIRVYVNEENLGVVKNFEKAVKLCAGDVIFFCDQDDIWMRNKVQSVVKYFEENKSRLAVISNAELINDNGTCLNKTLWDTLLVKGTSEKTFDVFRYMLLYRNIVTGACLAIKKEALPIIIPFRCTPSLLHDEWIGLKLGAINAIGCLNESLTEYRIHSLQQTNGMWNKSEEEIMKRVSILNGEIEKDPLLHFRHWKKRWNYLQTVSSLGVKYNGPLINEIQSLRKQALLTMISHKKKIPRKLQLLKLLLRGEENISTMDLIKV